MMPLRVIVVDQKDPDIHVAAESVDEEMKRKEAGECLSRSFIRSIHSADTRVLQTGLSPTLGHVL